MCHLVGSAKTGSDGALQRANHLEKELNALLVEVTSGAREAAGVPPEYAVTPEAETGPEADREVVATSDAPHSSGVELENATTHEGPEVSFNP